MRTPLALAAITTTIALTLSACGGDETLSQGDRDQASAAALKYVGGGAVTDAERGDGDDGYAYEVEVTLPGGTDIDVELDESFAVTNNPAKASDFTEGAATTSADDRPLTGDTLRKATAAALAETGGGTVTETSGSDERGHEYEVEIDLDNGQDVTVELDEAFKVTRVDR